ncbi:MFS transporter [Aeromicrobium wangtongii]|uniref:MFS transporter n=1 Tax=Aeromicrobium wangtongii TaxID=2969247 RepID=A0ABY5MA56_9ACTN|nr:MFS transporter [Aeromicrobium wangtongii]MCD9199653.1 MFS transporter [Aeromicrobium wangtongii]UUP14004.1 MFS transporter [Aeromicrobium wangtongii]
MGFSGYAQLWSDRRLRALFVAAFFARIPALAAPLVLTLYVVEELGGDYKQAGLIAAATTVGAGVGSPWRGRLIDRLGIRRAIVPSIVMIGLLYPVATVATYAWLIPVSFLMGLFLIPIFSIVRLALSVMVTERQRRTAFSADSIVAEASFIIGPAVGALLVTQVSAAAALYAIGACEVIAGLIFWVLDPPTRSVTAVDAEEPETTPVATSFVSAPLVFLFLLSGGAMAALFGTDLGVVAELRELDEVSSVGIAYGAWGLSSLVGGLVYGSLSRSIRPTYLLLALGLATIPVGLADGVWSLSLLVIPAGLLCAPTMTAASEWIAKLVPEARRGEAMGWQGTAYTVGGAVSSPVIGAGIDGVGAWGGFVIGGAIATAIACVALFAQMVPRWRPSPELASIDGVRR